MATNQPTKLLLVLVLKIFQEEKVMTIVLFSPKNITVKIKQIRGGCKVAEKKKKKGGGGGIEIKKKNCIGFLKSIRGRWAPVPSQQDLLFSVGIQLTMKIEEDPVHVGNYIKAHTC